MLLLCYNVFLEAIKTAEKRVKFLPGYPFLFRFVNHSNDNLEERIEFETVLLTFFKLKLCVFELFHVFLKIETSIFNVGMSTSDDFVHHNAQRIDITLIV